MSRLDAAMAASPNAWAAMEGGGADAARGREDLQVRVCVGSWMSGGGQRPPLEQCDPRARSRATARLTRGLAGV